MKFSIIIPVYNVEKYLKKCLLSLLHQTYSDFEVLIIDDGSTDNSIKIINEYTKKDSRFSIYEQVNSGQGSARNNGIRRAKGDYILFLDADDYLALDALRKLSNKISQSSSDVISFNCIIDHGIIKKKSILNDGFHGHFNAIKDSSILTVPSNSTARIVKRELLLNNNIYFNENVMYEDIGFTIKVMAYAKDVLFIDDCLYFYVQRPSSTMHTNSIAKKEAILSTCQQVLETQKRDLILLKYNTEVEYILVNIILFVLLPSINAIDYNSQIQYEFVDFILKEFPNILENSYFKNKKKKLKVLLNYNFKGYHYRFNILNSLKKKIHI